MKKFGAIALLMAAGMLYAQDVAQPAPPQADNGVASELRQLRQAIETQQKQIERQQREIDSLRDQLAQPQAVSSSTAASPRVIDAALHTAMPAAEPEAANYGEGRDEDKESPLSFRIGKTEFTPGGWADFSTVFRTTNLGSGLATSFNFLPYNNTIQGHLSELRMTAAYSRVSLKAHGMYGENDFTAYVEADFLGNDAANKFVSTNSTTNRLRHYWVDLRRNKWEFFGGQTWSWLTPNRRGVSPVNADVFTTINNDPNHQVGLPFTRAAQFRVAYHPNQHWAFGLALENPEQYVGAGEVIFPFAFNAALGLQWDAANNSATPNLHPDFIPKIAYDTDFMGGRHFHLEAAGLITTKKITNVPIGGTSFVSHTATGGGVEFAGSVDILKQWRFVASGFYANGAGRYIFGLGPDAVVRPNAAANNIDILLVTSGSGILGFEFPLTDKTTIATYYGGAYFDREFFQDTTSPLLIKPWIGFGGPNSPISANRALQEATLDWTQTLWSDNNYGKLQVVTQFSYVTRAPWFVAAGAPKNAHAAMGWVTLRYILP